MKSRTSRLIYILTATTPTYQHSVDMSSHPLPAAGFNPLLQFRLTRFMKLPTLSREDKINCWKEIDRIYDNLVDANGGTRSLPAIEQLIGHPLHNPILANNSLLAGVNFPAEVYIWCLERKEDGVLDEAIAHLGQTKPFLVGLEQCLTTQERENRHSTSREKEEEQPQHRPIPPNLVQSYSDVLAFRHWYRSLTSRPVPQNQAEVIGDFNNRAEIAQLLFDAINDEPANMVENIDNNVDENDQSEEGNGPKEKKIHPQVVKVRHISPLSKLALSWDLQVSNPQISTAVLQPYERV